MHYYIAAYLLLLLVVVTNSKGLSIINLINIHTYIHTSYEVEYELVLL